jgi:hypothetical protein
MRQKTHRRVFCCWSYGPHYYAVKLDDPTNSCAINTECLQLSSPLVPPPRLVITLPLLCIVRSTFNFNLSLFRPCSRYAKNKEVANQTLLSGPLFETLRPWGQRMTGIRLLCLILINPYWSRTGVVERWILLSVVIGNWAGHTDLEN